MNSSLITKRAVGWTIDIILIFVISLFVYRRFYFMDGFFSWTWYTAVGMRILASILLTIFLISLFAFIFHGSTPGMLLFDLRVRTNNGKNVDFWQAIVRELLYLTPQMVIVNAVYMFSVQTNRSLSDLMTNTFITEK